MPLTFLMSPAAVRRRGIYDPENPALGRDFYVPEKRLFGRIEEIPFGGKGWTYTRFYNEAKEEWENKIYPQVHEDIDDLSVGLKNSESAQEILTSAIELAVQSMENPRPSVRTVRS